MPPRFAHEQPSDTSSRLPVFRRPSDDFAVDGDWLSVQQAADAIGVAYRNVLGMIR
jgi:hypothetical protein